MFFFIPHKSISKGLLRDSGLAVGGAEPGVLQAARTGPAPQPGLRGRQHPRSRRLQQVIKHHFGLVFSRQNMD